MTNAQADKRLAVEIVKAVADQLDTEANAETLQKMAALDDDAFEAWLALWYGPSTNTPEGEAH